jgi:hypothetical protein
MGDMGAAQEAVDADRIERHQDDHQGDVGES